ncbi:dihydroneopterin aldolase [Martelella sp. FOR1707]
MSGRYTITMKNCAFYAYHGVLPEEERMGQRFFVDVIVDVDDAAALADDFTNAVDYGGLYPVVGAVVTERRFQLIEALAAAIAEAVAAYHQAITRVEVAVRKPSVPISGILDHVEARLVRDVR